MNTEVLDRGVPIQPEIDKLIEAFRGVPEGEVITHEQISFVIKVNVKTSRYRSVVASWQEHLLRHLGIQVGSLHGVGYRKLPPHERIDQNIKMFQRGLNSQERSVDRALRVDRNRLSNEDMTRLDHMTNLGASAVLQGRLTMRSIAQVSLPAPQSEMPRVGPPV